MQNTEEREAAVGFNIFHFRILTKVDFSKEKNPKIINCK